MTHFLVAEMAEVGRQQGCNGSQGEFSGKTKEKQHARERFSGHLIERTMLFQVVCLSYSFSCIFPEFHCKRGGDDGATSAEDWVPRVRQKENTKTEASPPVIRGSLKRGKNCLRFGRTFTSLSA